MRRARFAVAIGVVALVASGCIGFTVEKKVTNGTSTGPFTVHISCTNDDGTETEDLNFNGPGSQTNIFFDTSPTSDTTCDITEPVRAGATSVTIECVSPPTGVTCTPTTDGLQVLASQSLGYNETDVDITVTNDFTQVVPDPPFNVTAMLGSVIVSWTPPAFTGSGPITSYVVTESPTGAVFTVDGSTTTLTIPCPKPGTYTYTVQAVNASGPSVSSAPSNSVTVEATPAGCTAPVAQVRFTG